MKRSLLLWFYPIFVPLLFIVLDFAALASFSNGQEELGKQAPKSAVVPPTEKLPTAQKVIEKYISALGGYELLNSRNTIHYQAKANKSGDAFAYEVYIAKDRYYAKYDYENGRVFERVINNGVAWTKTNGSIRHVVGIELKELLSRHRAICPVTTWLDTHQSIEVLSREKVGVQDTFKLFFVDKDGFKKTRFFDVETGLIRRSIADEQYLTRTRHIVRDYLDFEHMGDALVSKTKLITSNQIGSSAIREYVFEVQLYEVDVKIPKGTFDIPKSIRRKLASKLN